MALSKMSLIVHKCPACGIPYRAFTPRHEFDRGWRRVCSGCERAFDTPIRYPKVRKWTMFEALMP